MKNVRMILSAVLFLTTSLASAKSITLYSVYDGVRLAPIFKPFTERTGIEVKVVNGTSDELIAKLKAEGVSTEADLHMDKDLVYHGAAHAAGLYRPFVSSVVSKNVPSHLVEKNNHWLTVFYRARVILYNKNKVSPSELSTYEALGDTKWHGRLCLRTSKNSYNQALAAFLVAHYGEEQTQDIFKDWVANFSEAPLKGDRDVINAVAEGRCDVGIANTYYLAPYIEANPDFAVRPFFPNQKTTGAHVNGVGIALTKHAKNVKEATMLLEYLTSEEIQAPVAKAFDQYPVNRKARISPTLVDFGSFVEDTTNIGTITTHTEAGINLLLRSEYK